MPTSCIAAPLYSAWANNRKISVWVEPADMYMTVAPYLAMMFFPERESASSEAAKMLRFSPCATQ